MPENSRKKVVVLGAGFAGLNAALKLRHMPVDVTIVDRRNHHTFQPLLYQVALAVLTPSDIAQSVRTIFRGSRNVEVLLDEAAGVDVAAASQRDHLLGDRPDGLRLGHGRLDAAVLDQRTGEVRIGRLAMGRVTAQLLAGALVTHGA